ncbi:MAG: 6-phosphogluconolactonase [Elusimicrobiota bacterium]|jgi:6-phosphogluconolactonase
MHPRPEVRVFDDAAALARAAAALVVEEALAAAARGVFRLVLCGGRTPKALFFLLAGPAGVGLPWERTHVFFSDERHVPPTHPESNVRLVRDLLLDRVPVPKEQVHAMPVGGSPDDDARRHEDELRRHFAGASPSFDLALLGLGEDGHTASLFPDSPALEEKTRWVLAVRGPKPPYARLTMTFPLLDAARHAVLLVSGEGKAGPLRALLDVSAEPRTLPAALLRPSRRLSVLADRDAAQDIPSSRS